MDERLTVRGTIPGLLRGCSPVLADGRHRGIVVGFDDDGHPLVWSADAVAAEDTDELVAPWHPSRVELDLNDATGRAHAAWRLAAQFPEAASYIDGVCGWAVWLSGYVSYIDDGVDETLLHLWRPHDPLFKGLNADDPTCLDDGSRWVHAEALRRAVLQVCGSGK